MQPPGSPETLQREQGGGLLVWKTRSSARFPVPMTAAQVLVLCLATPNPDTAPPPQPPPCWGLASAEGLGGSGLLGAFLIPP